MDYWRECVAEAFDDAKITATEEQIANVAGWVEGAHDNFGMAHGHDDIPNPRDDEVARLARELQVAREEKRCPVCGSEVEGKYQFGRLRSIECDSCGWRWGR